MSLNNEEVIYSDLDSRQIPQDDSLPDLFVRRKDGKDIRIIQLNLGEDGRVESALDEYEFTHYRDDLEISKNYLNIPGIGFILPESRIIWRNRDYVLKYGWHTNISNQTICTWYLVSLEEETPPKTVYAEMIDQFEIVHFQ